MNDLPYVLWVIAGLTMVSAVNRSFFFLSRRPLPLPDSSRRALRYAPLGALVAVVAPELVLTNDALTGTWHDARLFAAAATVAYALVRRRDMLGTIAVGMAVFLGLRFGLGW